MEPRRAWKRRGIVLCVFGMGILREICVKKDGIVLRRGNQRLFRLHGGQHVPFDGIAPDVRLEEHNGKRKRVVSLPAAAPLGYNPFEVSEDIENCTSPFNKSKLFETPATAQAGFVLSPNKTECVGGIEDFFHYRQIEEKDRNFDISISDESVFEKSLKTAETISGNLETKGYRDGNKSSALFDSPFGIAVLPSSDIIIADTFNRRIRKISREGVVSTIAGSGRSRVIDGRGTFAAFRSPNGLAVSPSGDIYVADTWAHRIRKISPDFEVTTIAGNGFAGHKDGLAVLPNGSLVQSMENLSFSFKDTELRANNITLSATASGINEINPQNEYFDDSIIKSMEKLSIKSNMRGRVIEKLTKLASFHTPYGVAWDNEGGLLVADTGNRAIRKIHIASGNVTTICSPETFEKLRNRSTRTKKREQKFLNSQIEILESYARDQKPYDFHREISEGKFGFVNPRCISVGSTGSAYVSDYDLHQIYEIDTYSGKVSLLAGSSIGFNDGLGSNAKMHHPSGIVATPDNHVYFVDIGNFAYRRIDPVGMVHTLGDMNRKTNLASLRASQDAEVFMPPCGLAITRKNTLLLLSDVYNSQIRTVRIPRPRKDPVVIRGGDGYSENFDINPQRDKESLKDLKKFEPDPQNRVSRVALSDIHIDFGD